MSNHRSNSKVEIPDLDNWLLDFSKKRFLKSYVRGRRRRPLGVLVAYESADGVHIGWSFCKIKTDRFNSGVGLYIAAHRAAKYPTLKKTPKAFLFKAAASWGGSDNGSQVPYAVIKMLPEFAERAARYFGKIKSKKKSDKVKA